MNTVLIHLGCQGPYITGTEPPAYMERCIEQYLLFNTAPLYVLTDRANVPLLKERPGVFPVAVEDYPSDKVDQFHAHYGYARDEFWAVSTTRFFYLEEFLRQNDLAPVVHFENDVLIYFDVTRYAPTFKRLYGDNMALTPCDDDQATSGFMYFGGIGALSSLNTFIIDVLAQHGMHGFEQKFKVHMTNDMTLMKRHADASPAAVSFLPVLPFGEFSAGYEEFGAIFDPGDFGQYTGGTRGYGPGMTYEGHIVGAVLRANPDSRVILRDEDGLRFPYFSHDDEHYKMNSLHIHSKNMDQFMSQSRE